MKKIIIENVKTLVFAFLIALFIRSFFFQPFYIPSSSMEENLLVGDRLFVSKFTYGYSKHSLPFSPDISDKRIFFSSPERGEVIVFKTPEDNDTDYIKRLIGLPGDKIQMPITVNSHRIGRAFGTHRVEFYNSRETISFQHIAHSRDIFASGAIAAAQWIISNPPGLYSFNDYLNKKL